MAKPWRISLSEENLEANANPFSLKTEVLMYRFSPKIVTAAPLKLYAQLGGFLAWIVLGGCSVAGDIYEYQFDNGLMDKDLETVGSDGDVGTDTYIDTDTDTNSDVNTDSDGEIEEDSDNLRDDEWICIDGECIPGSFVCDDEEDCYYRSGEGDISECDEYDEWMCEVGGCIPIGYLCDGEEDCLFGSDEGEDICCSADEWMCDYGDCISNDLVCDTYPDCMNGSDEFCYDCEEDEWTCNDGQCIPISYLCDGNEDCYYASDEGDICN